ncbi:hypothetical protein EDC96DRAFT_506134 [Choanephora cucurbitarum]|nr:hypothetical protein EDC96DRAFT_506134 [Choanephora cucurbitarum]
MTSFIVPPERFYVTIYFLVSIQFDILVMIRGAVDSIAFEHAFNYFIVAVLLSCMCVVF